jgi:hypothetical protein
MLGRGPTRKLPATLNVVTDCIADIAAGSEPRMFALSMSILAIWLLFAPHVPTHAHGSRRVLAHFVHDAPPVSSCILIHALHWSAGSSVELLPVHFVAPVPGHDDWPALLVSWYLPLEHVAQAVCPSAPLYLPPGQLMQLVLSAVG